MVKQVSFTTGAAPAVPKINPLVEALLRRALSERPIKHPLQGFDRLGKAALAAFLKKQDKDEEEEKQAGITKTFQEALAAGQSTPEQAIAPALADVTPGTELDPGGGFRVPAVPGDKQALINVLLGNKDTVRFGAELGFNDLFKDPEERFEPVFGPQGNIIGQRSSTTGQVSSDPRTRKSKLLTAEEEEQEIRIDVATQKPTKATMGDRKVALLNKWRAAQEGRGVWDNMDQAEWDMIIRADPMDILRRNLLQGMGRDPAASTSGSGAQAGSPGAGPLAFVTPLGPPPAAAGQPRSAPLASVSPLGPAAAAPQPGSIETMTVEELSELIYNEQAQNLSQDEKDRIFARLGALGFK